MGAIASIASITPLRFRSHDRSRSAAFDRHSCYNEEDCIDELLRRVTAVAQGVAADDHEIVLINDGSRDGTWAAMQRLAAANPRIIAINLSRNHGHQLALTAGSIWRGDR